MTIDVSENAKPLTVDEIVKLKHVNLPLGSLYQVALEVEADSFTSDWSDISSDEEIDELEYETDEDEEVVRNKMRNLPFMKAMVEKEKLSAKMEALIVEEEDSIDEEDDEEDVEEE